MEGQVISWPSYSNLGDRTITDSNYTHILAIVDRSGSMSACDTEMSAALNHFFREQAEIDGKCLVDYVQFDNTYEKVYDDRPVAEAEAVISPRGSTALLDAMGRGITELGNKLRNLAEVHRPGKVLVVVVTDGHENASKLWNADRVKALVEEQTGKWNWDFVFLGANIDAVAVGNLYGFQADKSMTFNTAHAGVTMDSLSVYASTYRGGGNAAFSDDDRKKAMVGS